MKIGHLYRGEWGRGAFLSFYNSFFRGEGGQGEAGDDEARLVVRMGAGINAFQP